MTNQKSETDTSNMPIEVKTENGLSVLYCGKYLYSKYNPKKNILKTIDSLCLKEGTLVLAFSPCLCFGLKELLKKLPENCYVVGIEYDDKLFELAKKYTNNLKGEENLHKNFMLVSKKYFSHLPFLLTQKTTSNELDIKFPKPGTFKRIIKIDFSAGTQFFYSEYEQLFRSLEDSLSRFWKNRITLVKFGRKYSRNLFRNIARLPKSFPLHFLEKKIDKPILVLGAGESLEKIVPQILQMREYFFIIAVDVSYRFLLSFKIEADIVVCEESQLAIANAFISFTKKSLLVTGITSFPDIYNFSKNNISYFSSQYDDNIFFNNLIARNILKPIFPPLGSVGLVAIYLAFFLRQDASVPIFFAGLDFSYSTGKTHATGTSPYINRVLLQKRLKSIENYDSSFAYGVVQVTSKTSEKIYSSPALISYAETFRYLFSNEKNIYDIGKSGVPLCAQMTVENVIKDLNKFLPNTTTKTLDFFLELNSNSISEYQKIIKEKIDAFYFLEDKKLNELKYILSKGHDIPENERNKKIESLISGMEYLYLHFPDGTNYSLLPSFLNRVRSEIDFFLKDIKIAKRILNEK